MYDVDMNMQFEKLKDGFIKVIKVLKFYLLRLPTEVYFETLGNFFVTRILWTIDGDIVHRGPFAQE